MTENTGTKLFGNFNITSGTGIPSVNLANGSFISIPINP